MPDRRFLCDVWQHGAKNIIIQLSAKIYKRAIEQTARGSRIKPSKSVSSTVESAQPNSNYQTYQLKFLRKKASWRSLKTPKKLPFSKQKSLSLVNGRKVDYLLVLL